MSTKRERFAKHMACVDSYIEHQMCRRTEAEREMFRKKQIAMYDDKLERYSEKLQHLIILTGNKARARQ